MKLLKGFAKIAVGATVALIVVIVLIAVLVSAGAKQAQKESDKHAITQAQYDSIRLGTSEATVRARLGAPNSSDSSQAQFGSAPVGQDCIYYNRKGELLHIFQFCFDHGTHKLEAKNSV
jgi:hypothetical protein